MCPRDGTKRKSAAPSCSRLMWSAAKPVASRASRKPSTSLPVKGSSRNSLGRYLAQPTRKAYRVPLPAGCAASRAGNARRTNRKATTIARRSCDMACTCADPHGLEVPRRRLPAAADGLGLDAPAAFITIAARTPGAAVPTTGSESGAANRTTILRCRKRKTKPTGRAQEACWASSCTADHALSWKAAAWSSGRKQRRILGNRGAPYACGHVSLNRDYLFDNWRGIRPHQGTYRWETLSLGRRT